MRCFQRRVRNASGDEEEEEEVERQRLQKRRGGHFTLFYIVYFYMEGEEEATDHGDLHALLLEDYDENCRVDQTQFTRPDNLVKALT